MQPVGHSEVLRLLTKRNHDIGDHRTQVVCRLHALLAELAGGGIAKEMYASDVERFLVDHKPETTVEQIRFELGTELLGDLRRLDEQLKASHKRIREAVRASGTSLTELFGVGPIIAGTLIGFTATSPGSRTGITSPPTTAPLQSSSLLEDGWSTGSLGAGTGRSIMHSTWLQLASFASRIQRDAPISITRSPTARPSARRSARSSVRSATPSIANFSSTPDEPGDSGSGRTLGSGSLPARSASHP